MTIAMYPGRFDPVTNGHMDIVRRASQIFEGVVVGIADSKSTLFTTDERLHLFEEAIGRQATRLMAAPAPPTPPTAPTPSTPPPADPAASGARWSGRRRAATRWSCSSPLTASSRS